MAEGRRFCENCGAGIGETTNFCPNCGAAQKPDPDVPNDPPSGERRTRRISTPEVPGVPPPPQEQEKPKGSWLRTIIIVLVILIVLVALASGGGGEDGSTGGPGAGQTFTSENYAELATDPGSFRGASVDIEGRVLRNPEVRGERTDFQMFADPENSEWNTVVHADSAPSGLAGGDTVRVRGTVEGVFRGENAFGASITAPEVQADSVEITETEAQRKANRRP